MVGRLFWTIELQSPTRKRKHKNKRQRSGSFDGTRSGEAMDRWSACAFVCRRGESIISGAGVEARWSSRDAERWTSAVCGESVPGCPRRTPYSTDQRGDRDRCLFIKFNYSCIYIPIYIWSSLSDIQLYLSVYVISIASVGININALPYLSHFLSFASASTIDRPEIQPSADIGSRWES